MTRPNLSVGVLAAVCVGTLLWCAWLILAADLPRGAHLASWFLWLLSTAAAVTLLAYLREFLAHREAVGSDAGWKPLPGLVLLWIGGLTALVSFAFILPDRSPSGSPAKQDTAGTSLTSATVSRAGGSGSSTAPSSASGSSTTRAASTSASRSVPARTTPPSSGATTPARTSSTSSTATHASTTSTSSTTAPLIDLHILPTQAHPTTPPGQ